MVTVKAGALADLVRDIFAKAGCSGAEAERISKYLVSANLTGHDSHGVVRVPRYVQGKKPASWSRTVRSRSSPRRRCWRWSTACTASARRWRRRRSPSASTNAAGMGSPWWRCRNAGHIGRVGDWAEMAAEAGLVSVHFVNASGSVLVAPFGGTERRLSTAPFVVGVPRPGQTPIILDFATSVVAEGKVLVASQGGKKLPDNALIDRDGKMSADPHLLYGDVHRRLVRAITARARAPSAPSATTRAQAWRSCASCSAARSPA